MTKGKKIAIGIGVVVAIIWFSTGFHSNPSDKAASSQPAAPSTPAQTAPAAPATATATPTPAKPTFTVDDQAYKEKIMDHVKRFSDHLSKFSDLSSRFNPADQNWVVDMAVNLTEMKALADEGITITPTPLFSGVHAEYVQAMNDYKTVATELPNAIDKMDNARIKELTASMDSGSKHLNNATAKAQEVQKQFG